MYATQQREFHFKLGTYLASLLRRAVMKSFTSEVLRAKAFESKDHLPRCTHSPIFSSSSSSSLVSTANGRDPLMLKKRLTRQHSLRSPDHNDQRPFLLATFGSLSHNQTMKINIAWQLKRRQPAAILDSIKWNNYPPSSPHPQSNDEGAKEQKTRHFSIIEMGMGWSRCSIYFVQDCSSTGDLKLTCLKNVKTVTTLWKQKEHFSLLKCWVDNHCQI